MIHRFFTLEPLLFIGLFFCFLPCHSQGQHPLEKSFAQYQALKNQTFFGVKWISVGPVMNAARVEAVQADPKTPGTMYAAFGSGNLWKTTNHGLTWQPIFENQPALGIGDIALAPSDPNIIYLGSGESLRKNRNFTMPGNGVYCSDDAGLSWRHIGLDDAWHIGEIAVHPTDPDIAYVAVLGKFWSKGNVKGLYRTKNGGENWERVLFVDDNTRANDVVIAPGNPDVVYVSVWENNIDTVLMESVYGSQSGIYKSEDGGDTWKRLENGLPNNPKVGRIGLAVSHQDPNKVYALIDNRMKAPMNRAEVYKSTNGGELWQRTHQEDLHIFSIIGWYFADIYVNPTDDNEIFGLGVRIAHSEDGGKTFSLLGGQVSHLHPSAAQTLHLDHCEMWINPDNPNHLVLGNDGGLYVSYDKGQNWLHYNNIPAGEYYDITLDNQQPYLIYGGTQDDATAFGPAREWNNVGKDPWQYLWIDAWSGGDGCVTQVDPEDPNTVYYSAQEGAIRRKDMLADTSKGISPRQIEAFRDTLAYHFITPYFISPHNAKTLYHGGNFVFKSTNRGDDWERISPDLSVSSDLEKQALATTALIESRLQKGLLYAGTDQGAFWSSQDDGVVWHETVEGLPQAYIRSICPSNFSAARVYVAMSGINYDNLQPYLFVSEDYGKTFRNIVGNLPEEPINTVLEDPNFENILYAGAYRGVYISLDRGLSWSLLGKNLPAVSIGDLEIQERAQDLIVGTHGRGIYVIDLEPIYELNKKGFPPTKNILLPVPEARLPKRRESHHDIDKRTITKVPITFWAKKATDVSLIIKDGDGTEIWQKDIKAHSGLNQYRWDLVTKEVSSDMPYFIHYQNYIRQGNYFFSIEIDGELLTQPLKVVDQ